MQKSFPLFIEAISRYPDYFQSRQLLSLLNDSDIEALKKLGLLKRGSDLGEVTCPSCHDGHFLEVRIEGDRPYCFCSTSDTAHNYLEPQDVETWHFEADIFLQQMALQLGIDDRVEKLTVPNMWHVGGFSKDDTRHDCYYYQGKNTEVALSHIGGLPSSMRRYILFTNKQTNFASPTMEHEFLHVPITDVVSLKRGSPSFAKKVFNEYLVSGFRVVRFNVKNGDLIVNGKRIVTIPLSNPEYYFALKLWVNFNEPVANEDTKNFIYAKTKREYADTSDNLCYKQKEKIKKASDAPGLVDCIFKTANDINGENAFIMRNP